LRGNALLHPGIRGTCLHRRDMATTWACGTDVLKAA
jgi:hypothetical protein